MDELEGIDAGTYKSLINVTNNDPGARGNVEMTNLPPLVTDDDESKQAPVPAIHKSGSTQEILNLTLHQCARNGDVKSAKILISNMGGHLKKKINIVDEDDLTPLHYAARHNHLGVLKLLIEHQADITAVDEEGLTPLHYASRFKRESKKRAEVTEEEETNGIPTSDTMEDLQSAISFLVSKGADVNVRDIYGQTPLHYAAMRDNEVALRELLAYPNTMVEASDKQGMTPLHMAASHNHPAIVKLLIKKGANLRCKDEADFTPLHAACTEGDISIVKMLFNAGLGRMDGLLYRVWSQTKMWMVTHV